MKNITSHAHKFKKLDSIIVVVLAVLTCCGPVGAATLPPTAALMPQETALLVNTENFSVLKTHFEQTSMYKLCQDPAMAAFVKNAKTKWQEKIRKTNNDIIKAVFDSGLLPQGKAAFALVLNKRAMDANEPVSLFLAQWGHNTDAIKQSIDKTVAEAVSKGFGQKNENYQGVKITTLIAGPDPAQTASSAYTLSYCFLDDCLIGSSDLDCVKFVIAHIKSAASITLAGDLDYINCMGSVGTGGDVSVYVNIKQIIKTVIADDTTGKAKTTIANLGVDNVAAFAGSVRVADSPSTACRAKAVLKTSGVRKGVCKMLEMAAGSITVPRFVPASVCSATFWNFDIKNAYTELASIVSSFSPMAGMLMYMPLVPSGPDAQVPLTLKDIIDHLGSQIIITRAVNKPVTPSSQPTQETLVAVAVNNRDALTRSLSRLHSQLLAANKPDARRELLGHTIYLVDSIPALFMAPGQKVPMQSLAGPTEQQEQVLAFTVTDTHLICGAEPVVERAVRSLSSTDSVSLASAKWFNNAKSAIPSVVGVAALEDSQAMTEVLWSVLRQGVKDPAITVPAIAGPADVFGPRFFTELFDFTLLPDFAAVQKYFGLTAFYGLTRPDSLYFEYKYLVPAGGQ